MTQESTILCKAEFSLPDRDASLLLMDLKNRLEYRQSHIVDLAVWLLMQRIGSPMFTSEYLSFYEAGCWKDAGPKDMKLFTFKLPEDVVKNIELLAHTIVAEDHGEAVTFALWHAERSFGKDPYLIKDGDDWTLLDEGVAVMPSPSKPQNQARQAVFKVIKGGLGEE